MTHMCPARCGSMQTMRAMALNVMFPIDFLTLFTLFNFQHIFLKPAFYTLFFRTFSHIALIAFNFYVVSESPAVIRAGGGIVDLKVQFRNNASSWISFIVGASIGWKVLTMRDAFGGPEFWEGAEENKFLWYGTTLQFAQILGGHVLSIFVLSAGEQNQHTEFECFMIESRQPIAPVWCLFVHHMWEFPTWKGDVKVFALTQGTKGDKTTNISVKFVAYLEEGYRMKTSFTSGSPKSTLLSNLTSMARRASPSARSSSNSRTQRTSPVLLPASAPLVLPDCSA